MVKKKSMRRSEKELALKRRKEVTADETPMAKEAGERRVGATPEGVVVLEVQGDKGKGAQEGEEHMTAMGPKMQVESGSAGPEVPQGEGEEARLKTAFYHAPAVSGVLEGVGVEGRTVANCLL